jgi:hypothetical protein
VGRAPFLGEKLNIRDGIGAGLIVLGAIVLLFEIVCASKARERAYYRKGAALCAEGVLRFSEFA